MRILFTVDWRVARLEVDSDAIQSPDKVVKNKRYWFFEYWPDPLCQIDVVDIGNIPLISAFENKVLSFFIVKPFTAWLKRKKYDLIISHSARSALAFSFLRSLLGERLPPHVVIDIGSFNGGRNNPVELGLIKKASQSLRGIIAHSSIQSEFYDKYMPHVPYRFVHFGVDADYFKPGLVKQEDYILSFGSHRRDYGTLIEAWKSIGDRRVRLKIIGVDTIPGLASVPDNVEIAGRVPIQVLIENILRARFVVIPLPYHNYSYGQMSFLQSMALGKCCVVTRTPSSQDYLTHNEDAVLVRPYDREDLSEKIRTLLDDEPLRDHIARNGRRRIEDKCNEKNMAAEMHKFVSDLV